MFERLRAAIEAALAAATPQQDMRSLAGAMREAVIELRAAVAHMRDDIATTERQLAGEQRARADAERRKGLAGGIGDHETVDVAQRFEARHSERASMLEQKLSAQRAELALAESELAEMTDQLRRAEREKPLSSRAGKAWSAAPSDADLTGDLLDGGLDRRAREAAAEAQLQELKKKMGK